VKRPLFLLLVVMLIVGMGATALAADGPVGRAALPSTGRVLIVAGGDIDVPAGDQADAVIVMGGDARVAGTVGTLVMVSGTASVVDGATVGDLVLVGGTADLDAGATVVGDVMQLGGSVAQGLDAAIQGQHIDLAAGIATLGMFLGAMAIVAWVGVALATFLGSMALASLAGRQLRTAAWAMGRDLGMSILVGVLSLIVLPVVALLAMATVIGIPTGLAILLVVWPALAFVGYLVAAIGIGDWLLGRRAGYVPAERPHLAATVGLLVGLVLGIIPILTAILSIVGAGAVLVAVWHTWRGERPMGMATPQPQPTVA
jgi:hypothetical protein